MLMKFIEMPLQQFIQQFPSFSLPPGIDKTDKNYIVRISPALGLLEFGYESDEWKIK